MIPIYPEVVTFPIYEQAVGDIRRLDHWNALTQVRKKYRGKYYLFIVKVICYESEIEAIKRLIIEVTKAIHFVKINLKFKPIDGTSLFELDKDQDEESVRVKKTYCHYGRTQ